MPVTTRAAWATSSRPVAAARALYVLATLYQEADLMDQSVRHYRRATLLARRENDEQLLAAVHRYMTLAQVQQVRHPPLAVVAGEQALEAPAKPAPEAKDAFAMAMAKIKAAKREGSGCDCHNG